MHKGPYSKLCDAYAFALEWIEENGVQISGYAREQYIHGIWNKQDEAEWQTELQLSFVKNSAKLK